MSKAPLKVMLIDDDDVILETLEFNLKRHGFETFTFKSGKDALAQFDAKNPSLIIVDWMMPEMVGPEVVKLIRSRSADIPILMLTGRAQPSDVAEGLSSGADDYLAKPFSVVELMARIQALLRRSLKDTPAALGIGKLTVGELSLDDDAKSVFYKSRPVDLSPKEFSLLKVLMKNAGKTLSTETLLNKVWGADFGGDTKTVAVHVRWLRQKLEEDPKNPLLLETVHRSGYRLNEVISSRGEKE